MGRGHNDRRNDRRNGHDRNNRNNERNDRFQPREAYDPTLEQVVGTAGSIKLSDYARIEVRYVRYRGTGPARIEIRKLGINRDQEEYDSPNLGRMKHETVTELVAILNAAQENCALDRAPRINTETIVTHEEPRRTRRYRGGDDNAQADD